MVKKQQVIDLHRQDPTLTSGQIAKMLGCGAGYVVATFHREGLKLPKSDLIQAPRLREREACAKLAEEMGAPEIAAAIRRRGNA